MFCLKIPMRHFWSFSTSITIRFLLGFWYFNWIYFSVIYSVTPDSGPSQISIVTDTTSTNVTTRQWRMRIHQYECGSPNLGKCFALKLKALNTSFKLFFFSLAPSGCLQYFSAASGQFTSFNYKTIAPSGDGPNHLANLNYAICFRIANGFCGIKYR